MSPPALHFLDLTLPTVAENLALDEALLLEAEEGSGPELLRLWEWPGPAVVLGAGCSLALDVDEAACDRDGVPVLRRSSGGGTVLLGRGCLLYTLVLAFRRAPALGDIHSSYRYILERMRACLVDLVPGVEEAGVSDLAADGLKFSGNAQQRKRSHLLHHGTLLYDFDLGRVSAYLRQPKRQPDYRQDRGHAAFLMNLPLGRGELARRIQSEWRAEAAVPGWPVERVQDLVESKYSLTEWTKRR